MSFSNPNQTNPATKFIIFKGDKGVFQYFDKEAGEKGENIELKMPLYFIVLDELSTIKGFNDETQSGVYSNEVHNLSNEKLNVRTFKGGRSVTGIYKDIKADIAALGGKFCKSVYALLVTSEGNEIVNFQFSGASFSAWLDCRINTNQYCVGVVGVSDEKKGVIKYKKPIFKAFAIKPEIREAAIAADNKLQAYIEQYKQTLVEKEVTEAPNTNFTDEVANVDDLPF